MPHSKLMILAFGTLTLSACSFDAGVATRTEERALNLTGVREVRVRTFNGSIEVTSRVAHPALDARIRGAADVLVQREGNVLVVTGIKKPVWSMDRGVSVRLALPDGLSLNLRSSNGNIDVSSGARSVNVGTSNGSVDVRGVKGEVRVETSNGRVTLRDVTLGLGSRNSVRTSNGSVRIDGLNTLGGLDARGETSNGNISVNATDFEVNSDRRSFTARQAGGNPAVLTVETSNGSIDFAE